MPPDEPRRAPARPKPRPAPGGRPAGRGRAGPAPAARPGGRAGRRLAEEDARERTQRRRVTGAIIAVVVLIAIGIARALATRDAEVAPAAVAPPNRPPEIQSLELVLTSSSIVARPQGRDLDGDRFRYRYRWTVGGQPQAAQGALLSRRLATPGTTVEVEATPVDRYGTGRPMRSSLTLEPAP